MHILLVEDLGQLATYLDQLLVKNNNTCDRAVTAAIGVERLKTVSLKPYDRVVCDVGVEGFEEVYATANRNKIPISLLAFHEGPLEHLAEHPLANQIRFTDTDEGFLAEINPPTGKAERI